MQIEDVTLDDVLKGKNKMKKDLMKTNVYDTQNIMVIVGSCLEKM